MRSGGYRLLAYIWHSAAAMAALAIGERWRKSSILK